MRTNKAKEEMKILLLSIKYGNTIGITLVSKGRLGFSINKFRRLGFINGYSCSTIVEPELIETSGVLPKIFMLP